MTEAIAEEGARLDKTEMHRLRHFEWLGMRQADLRNATSHTEAASLSF